MSAYLLAIIDTNTLTIKRVVLASQDGMAMSCTPQGCAYATLIKFDGRDYQTATNNMLRWMVNTFENNPFRWAVPLLLKTKIEEYANLARPDAEFTTLVQKDSPFYEELALLRDLLRLCNQHTFTQPNLLDLEAHAEPPNGIDARRED